MPIPSYRSPLFINPGKNNSKVCGSKKSFAVVELQKVTTNVPQTCGFAVADHALLFCGICGCRIERKFAVSSSGVYFIVNTSNKPKLQTSKSCLQKLLPKASKSVLYTMYMLLRSCAQSRLNKKYLFIYAFLLCLADLALAYN